MQRAVSKHTAHTHMGMTHTCSAKVCFRCLRHLRCGCYNFLTVLDFEVFACAFVPVNGLCIQVVCVRFVWPLAHCGPFTLSNTTDWRISQFLFQTKTFIWMLEFLVNSLHHTHTHILVYVRSWILHRAAGVCVCFIFHFVYSIMMGFRCSRCCITLRTKGTRKSTRTRGCNGECARHSHTVGSGSRDAWRDEEPKKE